MGTQSGSLLIGGFQFSAWRARLCSSTLVGHDSKPLPEGNHAVDPSCCTASWGCCATATCELVHDVSTREVFRS